MSEQNAFLNQLQIKFLVEECHCEVNSANWVSPDSQIAGIVPTPVSNPVIFVRVTSQRQNRVINSRANASDIRETECFAGGMDTVVLGNGSWAA